MWLAGAWLMAVAVAVAASLPVVVWETQSAAASSAVAGSKAVQPVAAEMAETAQAAPHRVVRAEGASWGRVRTVDSRRPHTIARCPCASPCFAPLRCVCTPPRCQYTRSFTTGQSFTKGKTGVARCVARGRDGRRTPPPHIALTASRHRSHGDGDGRIAAVARAVGSDHTEGMRAGEEATIPDAEKGVRGEIGAAQ